MKNLPQWLAIVGQSGCGKGAVLEIIGKLCKETGVEPLFISTGDLIRQAINLQTSTVKKMEQINNQGLRQPHLIASSLWFSKILHDLKPGQHIIHDGSPRSPEEFDLMWSLVETGYIESFKVLEVCVQEDLCQDRLVARTIRDMRTDLSLEGRPGEPDMQKIAIKMEWWTSSRREIIRRACYKEAYLGINNTSTLGELENQIKALFN